MTVTPKHPAAPESGSALSIDGAPKKPGLPAPLQGADAPLPHEFDQALGQVAVKPDPVIVQAKRDIEAGMVDTDMRATPGLDAERRAALVPVPAPEPGQQPTRETVRPVPGGQSSSAHGRTG